MSRVIALACSTVLTVCTAGATGAEAGAEWRYCLATWEPTQAVYVTMPFMSAASLSVLEGAYAEYLDGRGLKHEPVICPRAASEEQAILSREDAISYNRTRGLSINQASWHYGS